MLSTLIEMHQATFDSLARTWHAQGASSVSIWSGETLVASWPSLGHEKNAPVLFSPIEVDHRSIGTIQVAIQPGSDWQSRLNADARLIASLLPLLRDLHQVTGELIETRDQMLALYQITQSCRSCLSLDEALHVLVQNLVGFGKANHAFVVLLPTQGPALTLQYPGPVEEEQILEKFIRSLQHEESLVIEDKGRNILITQMQIQPNEKDNWTGAIGLVNTAQHKFGSPDIKLMKAVAAHAGAQLENIFLAESQIKLVRMQTEMELAQRVQASLLPKALPDLPGMTIWGASRQAHEVGGDFYDFILKPGCPPTFVVGDLSGKGFPAALLMSMTRTILRTDIHEYSTPEKILQSTNRALYEDLNRLSSFATLFISSYNPDSREFLFANAGHSPILYRPLGQDIRLLVADGPPLGIFPNSSSRNASMTLQPGDLLLIGTDGLTDAINPTGEHFGLPRLYQVIEKHAHLSPEKIGAAVFEALDQFTFPCDRFDDQTLVVMQCTC